MICRKCNTVNEPDHLYCESCGSDLAKQSKADGLARVNRPGCIGCLGLFLLCFLVVMTAGFFYLQSEGVIYTKAESGRALVYVTIYSPMVFQSELEESDRAKRDRAVELYANSVPIRLHTKYAAGVVNDKVHFKVRTVRLISKPTLAEGLVFDPDFAPIILGESETPEIETGYSQEAMLNLFGDRAPSAGTYETSIFVNSTLKRVVKFEIKPSPESN